MYVCPQCPIMHHDRRYNHTSGRPFRSTLRDFVLRALWPLRPCDTHTDAWVVHKICNILFHYLLAAKTKQMEMGLSANGINPKRLIERPMSNRNCLRTPEQEKRKRIKQKQPLPLSQKQTKPVLHMIVNNVNNMNSKSVQSATLAHHLRPIFGLVY